jgi:aspartate/methionine/tyrosine aminotransferase
VECSPLCQELTSFKVMDVLERAKALERVGRDIVHLEIGEPDFPTPSAVAEAAIQAIRQGHTHYTHSQGILELREAIAAHYHQEYGVHIHPDRIVVTPGTSPAMLLVFSLVLRPGQRVVLTDPCYPCYPNFLRFVGARPVFVPLRAEDGFQLDPTAVRAVLGPDVAGILINSPANPTGTVLEPWILAELAELGVPVFSDEIYHGLVYRGRAASMLEFSPQCFVFNGFSKLYAMTGWRLGYAIVPEHLVERLRVMQQNFFLCTSSIAQWAGLAALTETAADVAYMRAMYDTRRRYLVDRLRELGFGIAVEPTGAFYVFADARRYTHDSMAFVLELLEHAGVGVAPGADFGPGGEGFVRFSYANSLEQIQEGMDRLAQYLGRRAG